MLQGKHIWVIPLLTAIVVAGVGWWADGQLRRVVQQEIREDLQSTLVANVTALEIWMTNQKRVAAALAEEPRFKALALELLDTQRTLTNRAAATEAARQLLGTEKFGERIRTLGYPFAQIVNTNLLIVSENMRGRLIETGANMHEMMPDGITPFCVALGRQHWPTARALLAGPGAMMPFADPRPARELCEQAEMLFRVRSDDQECRGARHSSQLNSSQLNKQFTVKQLFQATLDKGFANLFSSKTWWILGIIRMVSS